MSASKFLLLTQTVFLGFLSMLTMAANAQIQLGDWRDHLPYSHCIKVAKASTKIYAATDNNLFVFDTHENSIQKLSKISGLSDMGVSTIEYYAAKNILLISYTNGNIDLLKDFQVTNIPDVKNKVMSGSKKANGIYFKDNFAYLCYSFGIVLLDLDKNEIKDTYVIGEPGIAYEVFSLTADDTYFYAGTSNGLFKASITDPFLVNYARWQRDATIPNNTGEFNQVAFFNGKLIANYTTTTDKTDRLYYLGSSGWNEFLSSQNDRRYEVRQTNNKLMVTNGSQVMVVNTDFQVDLIVKQYSFAAAVPRSSLIDESGIVWIADNEYGLVSYTPSSNISRSIVPNGPYTNHVWDLKYANGTIYATGGGLNASMNNLFHAGELYSFTNEAWSSILNYTTTDYIVATPDPLDKTTIYVGSWSSGIWAYQNGQVLANYKDKNSTLQSNITGQDYIRIGGITFDTNHNLWVTNGGVGSPISVRKTDGTWKSFPWGPVVNSPLAGNIHQDKYGQFWVVLPKGVGLFVFDVNNTIDNEKDDKYLVFRPKDALGDIVTNIYCVTSDRSNNVWVGTDHGPIMYPNPQNVFSGETDGTQVTIPRNDGKNTVDPLLGSETINCITIDGGNRKWFGTEKGGAFLFSPDGTKQLLHFNTDNSPIFSNTIQSITINDLTGEVFFGTAMGIISYRGKATAPNDDFTNVYVYPNPVRPDYHGDIVITGLIENCYVKITDISGNLVYHTKSIGGQAVWDGNMKNGRRVSTGVYLVFMSNDDGSKTYITKMLVIH
jgi:hypothetical protein